jgi:hypothetical protein
MSCGRNSFICLRSPLASCCAPSKARPTAVWLLDPERWNSFVRWCVSAFVCPHPPPLPADRGRGEGSRSGGSSFGGTAERDSDTGGPVGGSLTHTHVRRPAWHSARQRTRAHGRVRGARDLVFVVCMCCLLVCVSVCVCVCVSCFFVYLCRATRSACWARSFPSVCVRDSVLALDG